MSKRKRTLVVLFIMILLLLTAVVYAIGAVYFSDHFLPGSAVNGFSCSFMTVQQTEDLLTQQSRTYVLTIETRNHGQESITAEQVGMHYVSDGSVARMIREQDRYRWFLAFDKKKTYEMTVKTAYDPEMLYAAVENLKCFLPENIQEPVDAHLIQVDQSFAIAPEEEGASPDIRLVKEAALAAVDNGDTVLSLEETGCYKRPVVYRDNTLLSNQCDQLNRMLGAMITYDFGEYSERVDRNTVIYWIYQDTEGNYRLDKTKVREYIADLASKYDVPDMTSGFVSSENEEDLPFIVSSEVLESMPGTMNEMSAEELEQVYASGLYEWNPGRALDQETEAKWLYEAIMSGMIEVRVPDFGRGVRGEEHGE
ncbi:MAG: peptidoglycan binding domain-containing protein [Blautia sp.]|nr:peptidoglycan binding domain-containing protein [Blautia sp.]